jgi:hypothetical protein
LDDGAYLHFDGASWQSAKTGYQGDVLDLRVESEDSVFAITEQGSVIHYDGVHWSAQPVTPGPALRGIDTDLAGGIVIVGDAGRILRWNGAGWSHDLSPTKRDLRDVATLGPSLAIAVGQYALIEWNGDTWAPIAYGPPKDLNAIWSTSSGNAWSVGTFGVVLQREGNTGQWSAVNVPVLDDLHSIWGTSGGFLTAVGDSGTIIMASGDGIFTASPSPTKHNLHGVWGRSSTDIYAVGNAATVVHFNGIDWSLVTTGSLETSLQTIGGSAQEPWSLFSMGLHAVHLGPFLTVPDFASPRPNELWLNQTLEWTATGDTVASFQNYRMFGPTGSTAWSIMAPGALERFKLPDINAIENQLLFPNGTKRMVIYRVRHEGFDINKFDGRIFRLMDWRAWVLMTYLFDDNSTTVETGTVPGT